jgi:hypothetical protein
MVFRDRFAALAVALPVSTMWDQRGKHRLTDASVPSRRGRCQNSPVTPNALVTLAALSSSTRGRTLYRVARLGQGPTRTQHVCGCRYRASAGIVLS